MWVVATPIGNLGDLSRRAAEILRHVEWVAAEDTRRTGRLLEQYGLRARLLSLHEHNEASRIPRLLRLLAAGRDVALVSDAGTPLLSDPGARLVAAAADAGERVSPVPGPCSVTAALSVAGFGADRFVFDGFLPARDTARRSRLEALAEEPRTVAFFEAPHRIAACLRDLVEVCGGERPVVLARELTKVHETVLRGSLEEVLRRVEVDGNQQRGEIVVVLEGVPQRGAAVDADSTLRALLLEGVAVKQAARVAARLTGGRRNALYQRALELAESQTGGAKSVDPKRKG
ncbi:16S rRNA (cytidine(1402)-2'-O)-methyltransferase [Halorhodospira halophila]|uniref:16S rRNA (cytidine(1402)-2'-O)-methyltransferase n=1 Tax=Halorhodospira halophila TaxID=1053 RepID=UPI001A92C7CF|nr:16S rRNA (cytidine(1402)-2'-O)-methyltransferase [Halorhodospira halophila]